MNSSSKTTKRSHQWPNTSDQLVKTKSEIEKIEPRTMGEFEKSSQTKDFSTYKDISI